MEFKDYLNTDLIDDSVIPEEVRSKLQGEDAYIPLISPTLSKGEIRQAEDGYDQEAFDFLSLMARRNWIELIEFKNCAMHSCLASVEERVQHDGIAGYHSGFFGVAVRLACSLSLSQKIPFHDICSSRIVRFHGQRYDGNYLLKRTHVFPHVRFTLFLSTPETGEGVMHIDDSLGREFEIEPEAGKVVITDGNCKVNFAESPSEDLVVMEFTTTNYPWRYLIKYD